MFSGGTCKFRIGQVTFFRPPVPCTDEALNHVTEPRGRCSGKESRDLGSSPKSAHNECESTLQTINTMQMYETIGIGFHDS